MARRHASLEAAGQRRVGELLELEAGRVDRLVEVEIDVDATRTGEVERALEGRSRVGMEGRHPPEQLGARLERAPQTALAVARGRVGECRRERDQLHVQAPGELLAGCEHAAHGPLLDQLVHVDVGTHAQRAVRERAPEQSRSPVAHELLRARALDCADELDRVGERARCPRPAGKGAVGVDVEVGEGGEREAALRRRARLDRPHAPVCELELVDAVAARQHDRSQQGSLSRRHSS